MERKLKDMISQEMVLWRDQSRRHNFSPKGWIISEIVKNYYKDFFKNKEEFNIKEFCKKLELEVEKIDLNFNSLDKNIWGMLDRKNKKIYISEHLKNEQTIRFTIAHELAHFLIDQNETNDIYYRDRINIGKEVIYNDFAASFLVDIKQIQDYIDNKKLTFRELSKNYKVHYETIGILIDQELRKRKKINQIK